jgi:1,4-alpha-glucan branching enzyme
VQAQPAQAAAPTASRTAKVTFALKKPEAKHVSLCGDFNDWSPERTPMIRKEGGQWEVAVTLRPGKYQYKFVADDQWLVDPSALENVPNPHGSLNSVREVRN